MAQQFFMGLPEEKISLLASTENLRRWWGNFIAHGPKLSKARLFPEFLQGSQISAHRIVAKYDLVLVDPDGSLAIYDWKTYRNRPRRGWMADRVQTQVYLSLLHRTRDEFGKTTQTAPGALKMIYWYAEFPDQPEEFSEHDFDLSQSWSGLEQLVNEINARQSFPMTEEERRCSWCVYRSFCERGSIAGDGKVLEDIQTFEDFNLDQIQEIEF
jgi:hypothetical protein